MTGRGKRKDDNFRVERWKRERYLYFENGEISYLFCFFTPLLILIHSLHRPIDHQGERDDVPESFGKLYATWAN
jgi:hypothetical protein